MSSLVTLGDLLEVRREIAEEARYTQKNMDIIYTRLDELQQKIESLERLIEERGIQTTQ